MVHGVFITSAMAIVIYGVLQFAFLPYMQRRSARNKPTSKNLEAHAVVLNIQPTGKYIGNLTQVCMLIKVQPFGGRNFVAEAKQALSPMELSRLRAGSCLKVKYNPHNVKEVTVIR
jgi:hypothetical protein